MEEDQRVSSRVFADIPNEQQLRNYKQWAPFIRAAHQARTTNWGMSDNDKHVLGALAMLEEAEAMVQHQAEQIAALVTVNEEQASRIKGLEMTIGRMKKRTEDVK
jgi:hypothetical protein